MSMPSAPASADERQIHALEYIALYLDRIESHLERIASSAAGGTQLNAQIAVAASSIAAVLQKQNP